MKRYIRVIDLLALLGFAACAANGQQIGKFVPIAAGSDEDRALTEINATADPAQKLALIREAGCLIVVVSAHGNTDPVADLRNFEDDLLIADLDIVSGRVERLRDAVKKPRPNGRGAEIETLPGVQTPESRIYHRIHAAIAAHRLLPGASSSRTIDFGCAMRIGTVAGPSC